MKDTNIILRCTEEYKESIKEEAYELHMSVSQYFRFAQICRLNLEKSNPDLYEELLEMTKYYVL